jgi:hydrogenase/urease accessory protein HupE
MHLVLAALACATFIPGTFVWAHEIRPAVVNVSFGPDTRFDVELSTNIEALLANVSAKHSDTNESPNAQLYNDLRALAAPALRERVTTFLPKLLAGMTVELDGGPVNLRLAAVDIPPPGDLALARVSRLRFEGEVPGGAKTFRWFYATDFGSSVLRFKRAEDADVTAVWLKEGEKSQAYPLQGSIVSKTRLDVVWDYVVLGFTHILPKGLDHILFVLGLFLLSTRLQPLLVQVTAFTVAHSITLGLTIYGIFSLSPAIVEPLIAASIAYVAIENVFTSKLHAWRPFVVFGFGLLHGMGFAGVLQEVGLPRSEFLPGLISFNVGVELGQLAVITLAYLAVGVWGAKSPWYRGRVVVPASVAIAATGLYWTIERVIG